MITVKPTALPWDGGNMDDEFLAILIWIGSIGLIAIGLFSLSISVAKKRLTKWALQEHAFIVSKEMRWLRQGPFTFDLSSGRIVYRICVRGQDGSEQFCWAACSTSLVRGRSFVTIRNDGPPGFPVIVQPTCRE